MDISPAAVVAMNQVKVQNEVAVKVLRKSLDITAETGAELVQLMSQQSGVGQRVDLYA